MKIFDFLKKNGWIEPINSAKKPLSTQEFKKQIGKFLKQEMESLGFKGTGFRYLSESEHFVFAFGLQPNNHGGDFCVEFGIQPKELNAHMNGTPIDLKKIEYYTCEFRERLYFSPNKGLQWLKYEDTTEGNIENIRRVLKAFNEQAMPVINRFRNDPDILSSIETSDLDDMHSLSEKFGADFSFGSRVRFAWALAKIYENKNPSRAKEFAKYGLSWLQHENFLGKADLERIANK